MRTPASSGLEDCGDVRKSAVTQLRKSNVAFGISSVCASISSRLSSDSTRGHVATILGFTTSSVSNCTSSSSLRFEQRPRAPPAHAAFRRRRWPSTAQSCPPAASRPACSGRPFRRRIQRAAGLAWGEVQDRLGGIPSVHIRPLIRARKRLLKLFACEVCQELVLCAGHYGQSVGAHAELDKIPPRLTALEDFGAVCRPARVHQVGCAAAKGLETRSCAGDRHAYLPGNPAAWNPAATRSVSGPTVELPAVTMSPVRFGGATRSGTRTACSAAQRLQRHIHVRLRRREKAYFRQVIVGVLEIVIEKARQLRLLPQKLGSCVDEQWPGQRVLARCDRLGRGRDAIHAQQLQLTPVRLVIGIAEETDRGGPVLAHPRPARRHPRWSPAAWPPAPGLGNS